MNRKTRVLYVEHDLALMSLVSDRLRENTGLDLVFAGQNFDCTLEFAQKSAFDVALVEMLLGNDPRTGLDLALALRGINPNCGLVFFSEHVSRKLINSVPTKERMGFSVLQKRNPVDFNLIVSTLLSTAQGYSSIDEEIAYESENDNLVDVGVGAKLNVRDHQIMRMLVDGKNTEHIAKTIFLAPVTVRQELSRIYSVLVPSRTEGVHLRTQAVNEYLNQRGGGGGLLKDENLRLLPKTTREFLINAG